MKIRYVAPVDKNMASHRYRILIPGQELANRGHEISIGMPAEGHVNVYMKHFSPKEALASIAKTGGVFDVCDHHFDHEELGGYYREMCAMADQIVCPTAALADVILEETGKPSTIIPDPYEYDEGEPVFHDLSMGMWFGHNVNLIDLKDIELDCDMEVVSKFDKPGKNGPARLTPWSREAMITAFDRNEFAIFPVNHCDEKYACKSKNRIINALRAGLVCFSHPCGHFEGLEDYVIITDDLLESIREARRFHKEDPFHFKRMVREGQDFIRDIYSPAAVAGLWEIIFKNGRVAHEA